MLKAIRWRSTGEMPGAAVRAERTLTLALPKAGLARSPGDLYVADIGIPPVVYQPLGLAVEPFFGDRYWIQVLRGVRA